MVRTCVPRPAILAPIAIRQAARSAISGSRAALRMVVVPAAATAASRRFSVAPTEGWGSRISAPRRPSRAVARIVPSVSSIVAPMARKPVTWKSMPRRPMASPPGIGSAASPQRASNAPSSNTEARMRVTSSASIRCGCTRSAAIVTARPESLADQCMPQPRRCSSAASTATSRLAGTFRSVTRCGVSSADTINGSTAFLAPLIG